jgi:hypothetical protein
LAKTSALPTHELSAQLSIVAALLEAGIGFQKSPGWRGTTMFDPWREVEFGSAGEGSGPHPVIVSPGKNEYEHPP